MRFMMIVKLPESIQSGPPNPAELEAMGRYNDELRSAGVLLDLNGLTPPAEGARVKFHGASRTVTDGPYTETKELVAGYWVIQVRSKEEAIAWAKRIPFSTSVHPGEQVEVEVRRIAELDELPVTPERRAAAKSASERGNETR